MQQKTKTLIFNQHFSSWRKPLQTFPISEWKGQGEKVDKPPSHFPYKKTGARFNGKIES